MFLHTDGARSYKIGANRKEFLDGVIHDYVVHKAKIAKNGKKIKARYVQLFSHLLPDGRTVYTKGGSQIIDRGWRHLRKHVGSRSVGSSSVSAVTTRVRSAQWYYWMAGQDWWKETGAMFKELSTDVDV